VLCISCGYDTRTGEKRETQHVIETAAEAKKAAKRSKSVASGGLLRGTLFCFIAALIGALIWAVIVYLTMYEFVYVAIGLGALVGYGMALGNDGEGDSTFAGIIAAFMSLLGIVAAKVMTVMIFISALLGGALDGLEIDESAMAADAQEPAVIAADQEQPGDATEPVLPTDDVEEEEFDENVQFVGEEPNLVALFFSTMFRPFDAIFILIAFFTAYRVGSGEGSD
jgi:hypothetical protein